MRYPFIVGEKIYLRPLCWEDLNERYLSWVNDSEVTKYMETGTFPTDMEKLKEYYRKITNSSNDIILAIVLRKEFATKYDTHIGNITLNSINWIHRTANLGIMIGEKGYWGQGYGTEAIMLMVSHAFNKLNLHRIWAGIYAEHEASIKAFKGAGFTIEATLLQELYQDKIYHDKVIVGVINI